MNVTSATPDVRQLRDTAAAPTGTAVDADLEVAEATVAVATDTGAQDRRNTRQTRTYKACSRSRLHTCTPVCTAIPNARSHNAPPRARP